MDEQLGKLILKITLLGLTLLGLWSLTKILKPKRPTDGPSDPEIEALLDEAVKRELGGAEISTRVAALLEERQRLHRRVRWSKRLVWGTVALYSALVPIPTYFELPPGFARNEGLGIIFSILMGVGHTLNLLVSRRMLMVSRTVLILRRFGKSDSRRTVLPHVASEAAAGLAVPVTIVDSSFPGEPSPTIQLAVLWLYPALVTFVAFLGLWGLLIIGLDGMPGIVLWVVVVGLVGFFLYVLGEKLSVLHRARNSNEENYISVLHSVYESIRRKKGIYTGTKVLRFPDSVWQLAINMSLKEADAVIIDVTEISPALEWELRAAERVVQPESVVLAWSLEGEKHSALQARMERHLAAVLEGTRAAEQLAPDEVPAPQFAELIQIVGSDWVARCQKLPYEKSRRRAKREDLIRGEAGLTLSIALAHSERLKATPELETIQPK